MVAALVLWKPPEAAKEHLHLRDLVHGLGVRRVRIREDDRGYPGREHQCDARLVDRTAAATTPPPPATPPLRRGLALGAALLA